jgi:tetratricopeptide (TPR) repeat protein
MKKKIFLSAVTGQFKECRDALASDLRAIDCEVKVQDDFQQGPRTLIERLEEYVAQCDRIIALLGDAYGSEASGVAVPSIDPPRSYTQWEYFFALGQRLDGSRAPRKEIYLYLASDQFLVEHPVSQPVQHAARQRRFREEIEASGEHWTPFDTADQLCRRVLRDGWQMTERPPKPINLPYDSIGSLFKGREAFLDELRARLGVPDRRVTAIVNRLAMHGLGGVGKTRTAVEYAWRHAGDYLALLFVSGPTAPELRANLADLIGVLGITANAASVDRQLAQVLAWLDEHPGWLLIVDNVDTEDSAREMEQLLPRLRAGHVLITSRIGDWSAAVEPLELHLLAPDYAVAFLLDRTPHRRRTPDDATRAGSIARELDGLALALEQAGAYINHQRFSFGEYLERWHAKRDEVLRWHNPRLMQYPASVAVTWQTTFAQLTAPERLLLDILSWLAPQPIPLFLIEAKPLEESIHDPRAQLSGLSGYSLVRFDAGGDAVVVHRLVQEITRGRIPAADRTNRLRIALNAVNAVALADARDVRTWDIWTPLAAHVQAVSVHAADANLGGPTARLMNELGLYRQARVQFPESEYLYRRAMAIYEQSHGPDHPSVATCLLLLADLLRQSNRLAEAEPLSRRALEIHQRLYGSHDPELAKSLMSLALVLQATNRLVEAEPLFRRAIAIFEAALGADHPDVASALNSLANVLLATNRWAEAEPLFRRALAIDERSFGPDHPTFANDLNRMANVLMVANRLVEAEPLFRRAIAIVEAALGSDHPDVASALKSLANLLLATNRWAEAEPLFRRALEIDERSFGPDHPSVAEDLNGLATLLKDTNRPKEAEPLYRRALAIEERSFGPDHPEVAKALNDLGLLLMDTNRLVEAEPLLRRALEIDQRSFGVEHPGVAVKLNNLAIFFFRTNRLGEAEPLFRRALAIEERSFGPDHPRVATTLNNLSVLLNRRNRPAQAEPMSRRQLEIYLRFTRSTGHEHQRLRAAVRNYQSILLAVGLTPDQIRARLDDVGRPFGIPLSDLNSQDAG